MDTVPIDEPEDRPDGLRREWGYVKTTALVVVLANAVSADDVGQAIGAAVELGRRIQAGMIAEAGPGPAGCRLEIQP